MYVMSVLIILSDLPSPDVSTELHSPSGRTRTHCLKPVFFLLNAQQRTTVIQMSAAAAVQTLLVVHFCHFSVSQYWYSDASAFMNVIPHSEEESW